ncbi:hypothetical protein PG994_003595 [Apiospora phragmitis]|uniref:Uncharacterized protein n=1 Tax=Apiospora phragmitis TaxID=2905665 RepID=A0ABR1W2F3_9PEZI
MSRLTPESWKGKIQQVRQADDPGVQDVNGLSGANLPFYEAIWETVKRSRDVVDIRCRICIDPTRKPSLAPGHRMMPSLGTQSSSKLRHITVDVITDGGLAWYKVSTMTNRKLIYDLAKEAVYCGDSEDEEDDPFDNETADLDIPLLKIAKDITQAAANHRIRTKQPKTYIILPRVSEGEHIQVDKLLQLCRKTGAVILCGAALPPIPSFSIGLMGIMFPSQSSSFTEVLNIDTSVLVALASDFSILLCQGKVGIHELVCVREAAETLRHIVNTMGTPAEKARARVILGDDGAGTSQQELVTALQGLSIYQVPSQLRLPIRVVYADGINRRKTLPDASKRVLAGQLNPGLTSITCNAAAVKQMSTELERESEAGLDDAIWPSIWAFPTSRPLVGTPKPEGVVVRQKKHIGDCQTNGCTCGLDKFYADKDGQEDL